MGGRAPGRIGAGAARPAGDDCWPSSARSSTVIRRVIEGSGPGAELIFPRLFSFGGARSYTRGMLHQARQVPAFSTRGPGGQARHELGARGCPHRFLDEHVPELGELAHSRLPADLHNGENSKTRSKGQRHWDGRGRASPKLRVGDLSGRGGHEKDRHGRGRPRGLPTPANCGQTCSSCSRLQRPAACRTRLMMMLPGRDGGKRRDHARVDAQDSYGIPPCPHREPWDGPASVVCGDGPRDRANGWTARAAPGRWQAGRKEDRSCFGGRDRRARVPGRPGSSPRTARARGRSSTSTSSRAPSSRTARTKATRSRPSRPLGRWYREHGQCTSEEHSRPGAAPRHARGETLLHAQSAVPGKRRRKHFRITLSQMGGGEGGGARLGLGWATQRLGRPSHPRAAALQYFKQLFGPPVTNPRFEPDPEKGS